MSITEANNSLVFIIKVFEARLNSSKAKIGTMNPYCRFTYGQQSFTTQVQYNADKYPRWNEVITFEATQVGHIELTVVHKPLMFREVELGRCKIYISDLTRGKLIDWVTLSDSTNSLAGSIFLNISLDHKDAVNELKSAKHSASNSVDLREEYLRKLNEVELEREETEYYKKKYKRKLASLKQEKRTAINTTPVRTDESLLNMSVVEQENLKIVSIAQRIRREKAKLRKEEGEVKCKSDDLIKVEEEVKIQKEEIMKERKEMEKERQQLNAIRLQVQQEYLKLKTQHIEASSPRNHFEDSDNKENQLVSKIEQEIQEIQNVRLALTERQKLLSLNVDQIDSDRNNFQHEREAFEIEKRTFFENISKQKRDSLDRAVDRVKHAIRTPKMCEKIPKSPNSSSSRDGVLTESTGRILNY